MIASQIVDRMLQINEITECATGRFRKEKIKR